MTEQSRSQTAYVIYVRPRLPQGEWYSDPSLDVDNEADAVREAQRLAEENRVSTRVVRRTVVVTEEQLLVVAYTPRFTVTRLDDGEGATA